MLPTPPTPNPPDSPFVSTDQFIQVLLQREPRQCQQSRRLSTKIKFGLGVDQGLTRSKPDTGMVPLEHDDRFQHKSYSGPLSSLNASFTQGFIVTCRPWCDPLGNRRLLCDVKTSRPIPAIILKMPSAAAADDVAVYAKA